MNWSAEAEKKGGEVCLRQSHRQVEELLHKLNTGTEELDGMAVNRVSHLFSIHRASTQAHFHEPLVARLCHGTPWWD